MESRVKITIHEILTGVWKWKFIKGLHFPSEAQGKFLFRHGATFGLHYDTVVRRKKHGCRFNVLLFGAYVSVWVCGVIWNKLTFCLPGTNSSLLHFCKGGKKRNWNLASIQVRIELKNKETIKYTHTFPPSRHWVGPEPTVKLLYDMSLHVNVTLCHKYWLFW